MATRTRLDGRTRTNWLVVGVVLASAIAAGLSGIYFLYFPSGGSRGGPITLSGANALLGREAWHDIHTWGGAVMIAVIVIHFVLHWRWVVTMSRRVLLAIRSSNVKLSRGSRVNLAINIVVAVSFLVTAVSAIYFLLGTSGGYQGGRNPGWDPGFIFSRTTWDLIHTWAAVVMLSAAAAHLWIHWRWVVNVTKRAFRSLAQGHRPGVETVPAVVQVAGGSSPSQNRTD